jgi:hypothetical protein
MVCTRSVRVWEPEPNLEGATMNVGDLLADAFDRIGEVVHEVVTGLTADQLGYRPDGEANSICWLVWHLTRVQDDHVSEVAGTDQVWISGGWAERFGLPFAPSATGYGHTSGQVAALQVSDGSLLTGYHDAVLQQTGKFVRGLDAASLDRIVDESWDPPVTLGVRLVSVISDDLQHAGQAAYLRGLLERRPG